MKRQQIDEARNDVEKALKGNYRLVYPVLPKLEPEEEGYEESLKVARDTMAAYKRMLDTSKELHEYLNSGKKIKDGNTLRMQKEVEMKE